MSKKFPIASCKSFKTDSWHSRPSGDLLCVAVIPTAIIDRWWREGFRYTEHTHSEMLARLRAENMQKFITTSKRI